MLDGAELWSFICACLVWRSPSVFLRLGGCRISEADAIDADFIMGDQCFFTLAQRPNDCYERPPCMWSDADLRVSENQNGTFTLQAGPGGWKTRTEPTERSVDASGNSPEALARQLPQVLARLHETPPTVSHSCVYLNPDQGMRFGDVVALHRALTAQGVHKAKFAAALAQD